MGKASMCIRMLEYLSSGRVYKISELAELLETNPRNVVEYKKELEECGYYILSIPGRYGGLQLETHNLMPTIKFSEDEKEAFKDSYNYLLSRNDFMNKKEYQSAIAKVFSSISRYEFDNDVTVINRYPLSMPENEIQRRYTFLKKNAEKYITVMFKYISQKNVEKEYEFDPYELFMYNNAWFVIGWNHNFGDIGYFKINRITNFSETDKKFSIWKFYNKNEYITEYGFKNNGEWYHIEFEATGNYASLVKERIYGKNQEVISIDEHTSLVKVDMQNQENIMAFILGFGKNAKVLEPQWLKKQLAEVGETLISNYN